MNRSLDLIRFSLCLLFAAASAHSATLNWTNTAGGAWTNAANWSPNQTPTGADQVSIRAGADDLHPEQLQPGADSAPNQPADALLPGGEAMTGEGHHHQPLAETD